MQRISATVFAIVLLLFPLCMGYAGVDESVCAHGLAKDQLEIGYRNSVHAWSVVSRQRRVNAACCPLH
jgi:hypothetical protein